MILSFINIRVVSRGLLKTSGYAFGFQHSPWDLANVNEWNIIFDPYIIYVLTSCVLFRILQISVQCQTSPNPRP